MRELTPNMLWICVDQCDQTQLIGTIHSIMRKEPIKFNDVNQMVLGADALFDEIGYPQSFQKKRSMKEEERTPYERLAKEKQRSMEEIRETHGKQATFIVMVNARQFANWQGCLMDEQFVRKGNFRDVMELVHMLMQSSGINNESL